MPRVVLEDIHHDGLPVKLDYVFDHDEEGDSAEIPFVIDMNTMFRDKSPQRGGPLATSPQRRRSQAARGTPSPQKDASREVTAGDGSFYGGLLKNLSPEGVQKVSDDQVQNKENSPSIEVENRVEQEGTDLDVVVDPGVYYMDPNNDSEGNNEPITGIVRNAVKNVVKETKETKETNKLKRKKSKKVKPVEGDWDSSEDYVPNVEKVKNKGPRKKNISCEEAGIFIAPIRKDTKFTGEQKIYMANYLEIYKDIGKTIKHCSELWGFQVPKDAPRRALEKYSALKEIHGVEPTPEMFERKPQKYTEEQKEEIAEFAMENGTRAAAEYYMRKLKMFINESTVRSFLDAYRMKRGFEN